jgi:hypothetical protein
MMFSVARNLKTPFSAHPVLHDADVLKLERNQAENKPEAMDEKIAILLEEKVETGVAARLSLPG